MNVTLHHIKRSKARSSLSASTVRDDNFLHKAKIDKKLIRINTNTKNGEQQINELISRIAEIGNIIIILYRQIIDFYI